MPEAKAANTISVDRFLLGILLAWVPIVIVIAPIFVSVFGEITNQKATGLGAVAGGLSEALLTFGIVAFVTTQIVAIVFLVRSIGSAETSQNIVAILTAGFSVLVLVATGLLLWLMWFVIPRLNNR